MEHSRKQPVAGLLPHPGHADTQSVTVRQIVFVCEVDQSQVWLCLGLGQWCKGESLNVFCLPSSSGESWESSGGERAGSACLWTALQKFCSDLVFQLSSDLHSCKTNYMPLAFGSMSMDFQGQLHLPPESPAPSPSRPYYQKMSSHAQIWSQGAKIKSLVKRGLNVHCRKKFLCAVFWNWVLSKMFSHAQIWPQGAEKKLS